MTPGVTHLPRASITVAPGGASIDASPTASIKPPRRRRLPCGILSPAAVRIVAFAMKTGDCGSGR